MPKLKTNSGAKKRFHVNKKGTVKFRKANARHNFTNKSPKQKRHNRGTSTLVPQDAKKVIKELFPYGA
ncbi:50S ribosomal protein L35 [Vulgatibacter incomptus]|uniref:Large ribosomal subunit protein bL35 n=1 Tax=Vulgatibacter incomptus TaxID=1391653 RepID=A0A0K1PAU0_9BACT|nr:50S ribosomal protein L35 [Vulgatibacter incomptus]AKU90531.1 LSU ribosomal protein L35p [Vulgatibacter incomptus]